MLPLMEIFGGGFCWFCSVFDVAEDFVVVVFCFVLFLMYLKTVVVCFVLFLL